MKRFENLKAVLFDLDGTLVNTLPGLTELVNQMRSDFDKPPLSEEKVGKRNVCFGSACDDRFHGRTVS
jgi:phosphoglycolate phosphatase-like HAD superfamily hydrolase